MAQTSFGRRGRFCPTRRPSFYGVRKGLLSELISMGMVDLHARLLHRIALVQEGPSGKVLKKYRRAFAKPRDGLTKEGTLIYFASKRDCEACPLKPKCCPNTPARKIARSVHEAARDKARTIAKTEAYVVSRRERKKVEMLFAHLQAHPQARPIAPAWPKGSQGRVPVGRRRPKSEKIGEAHPPSDAPCFRHIRRRAPDPSALWSLQPILRPRPRRGSSTQLV